MRRVRRRPTSRDPTSQTSDFKSDTDLCQEDVGSCQMSQTSHFKSDNIPHPFYILLTRIPVRLEIGRLRRPISKKNGKMRNPWIHHLQGLWSDPCGAHRLQGVTVSMRDMAYAYVRYGLFTLLVVQARSHTNMHKCMRDVRM